MRDGISASRVWLPKNTEKQWSLVVDFLVERFPFISEEIIKDRMLRGDIVDQHGDAFSSSTPYQEEVFLFYYREIPDEPKIPFEENIIHKDDNIIVVDKPHFIPVTPTGRFVKESLLARLKHRFNNEAISPIHRLDRETAGIVMFTCNIDVRGDYQTLFQKREVKKVYQAIARTSQKTFPYTHKSRMEKGDPFFIMQEVAGDENSETVIDIHETQGDYCKYQLKPVTGKQHQLRVHMMSLGIPILNDPFYPDVLPDKGEDYSQPLQLLAKSISFIDPITQEQRYFESEQELNLDSLEISILNK